MGFAMLIDVTKCVGCRACTLACKEINGLPKAEPTELSAQTWSVVQQKEGLNVRRQCMHCLDPACASVCPVGALEKRPEGPVVYHEDRCIGCRYCMVACPFGVPKYEWEKALPRVQKCIFCFEKRVSQGEPTACASVCPTQATVFGERDALIREARRRIHADPAHYVDHIYGLQEAGGTSVLYLSCVPFDQLGFPAASTETPYPKLTWEILSKLPNVAATGGVMMFGLWWIVNRRNQLQGQASEAQETADGGER